MPTYQPEQISWEGCSEAQPPSGFQNVLSFRPFSATALAGVLYVQPTAGCLKNYKNPAHFDCLFMGK